MLWLVWGSEITRCSSLEFLSGRASYSSPSLLLTERCPRRSRKQLWPGLPGLIQRPGKAQLPCSPWGGGRKQHNSRGPEEGSAQEDTPPSFSSLALHLGMPSEQPLPSDAGSAGGGGCVSAQGCEPHCYSFPWAPAACSDQALEARVSRSPSRHSRQVPFHKQSKDSEMMVQEGPLQGVRSRGRRQVLLVPWTGLYVMGGCEADRCSHLVCPAQPTKGD